MKYTGFIKRSDEQSAHLVEIRGHNMLTESCRPDLSLVIVQAARLTQSSFLTTALGLVQLHVLKETTVARNRSKKKKMQLKNLSKSASQV